MTIQPHKQSLVEAAMAQSNHTTAASAVYRTLVAHPEVGNDNGRLSRRSDDLVRLSQIYGRSPFTRLSEARSQIGVDRAEFSRLLELFPLEPGLRSAITSGPAGQYWTNTILPLEDKGVLDAVLEGRPAYPSIVGLYPGPTCMFRCHFCVRVTGAKYAATALRPGTDALAKVIDEAPTSDPYMMYMSGGLEPLTNPQLGELAARAAGRGFKVTLYTNSFALTEQTLERQPGIWDLAAIRTSLYGLNDEEYEETVGKPRAFGRVRNNLSRFLQLRAKYGHGTRLGLNYLILPRRAHRLTALVEFLLELRGASPAGGVDFLNLRQDYSGRADGELDRVDRDELLEGLGRFDEMIAAELPELHVDYGYALNSMRYGVEAQLPRITAAQMRPKAHPQVSVQVDLLGDVYLYREAGFPDLPGATRYICGRVDDRHGLGRVVDDFVRHGKGISAAEGDQYFLDGFDQVVAARLNQMTDDLADGWGNARGFLR